MKRLIIFLTTLLIYNVCISQNKIVKLHPIIGETIDIEEKIYFKLFPNISDSGFNYGQVYLLNNNYYLYSYVSGDSTVSQIDSLDIKQYFINIEKRVASYSGNSTQDSFKVSKSVMFINKNNNAVNQSIMNPSIIKKTLKEAERIKILNNSADRQGLTGKDRESYINTGGAGSVSLKKKK